MKELLQRLSALDEDASAALKIITFFDTLLAQKAGLEPFVRGAAVLAGCPAGLAHPLHRIWLRVDAEGHALEPVEDAATARAWPHQELADGSGGVVWLERGGQDAAAHDAVLLERLASCVHLTIERVSPLDLDDAGAIEILLSATSTDDARRKAARRLRVREGGRVEVLALPATDGGHHLPRSAVVATAYGPVRASIVAGGEEWQAQRVGISPGTTLGEVPRAWDQALLALRVTSRLTPRVRWDELGALALLGEVDASRSVPDVERLAAATSEPWVADTLEAFTRSESVRAAAQLLGLHHSTVQARQVQLEETLGFRIGTTTGRVRVAAALAVHRLRTARFGDQA